MLRWSRSSGRRAVALVLTAILTIPSANADPVTCFPGLPCPNPSAMKLPSELQSDFKKKFGDHAGIFIVHTEAMILYYLKFMNNMIVPCQGIMSASGNLRVTETELELNRKRVGSKLISKLWEELNRESRNVSESESVKKRIVEYATADGGIEKACLRLLSQITGQMVGTAATLDQFLEDFEIKPSR